MSKVKVKAGSVNAKARHSHALVHSGLGLAQSGPGRVMQSGPGRVMEGAPGPVRGRVPRSHGLN